MCSCPNCRSSDKKFSKQLLSIATVVQEQNVENYIKYWKPIVKKKLLAAAKDGKFELSMSFVNFMKPKVTPDLGDFMIFIRKLLQESDFDGVQFTNHLYWRNYGTFLWKVLVKDSKDQIDFTYK